MSSTVQCSSRQLKDLVYECRRRKNVDPNEYYRSAEAILSKLIEASFNEQGRSLQISSGVVVDVAQLLVQNVLQSNFAHPHMSQLRCQIARLLINLTYGSIDCKRTLCLQEDFIKTVCILINKNYELVRIYSDLLRNMSWKCDEEIGLYLSEIVRPLASISVNISQRRLRSQNFSESRSSSNSLCEDEKTLNSVYSTLWNMALSPSKARETMCSVHNFLFYLLEWLQDQNYCVSLVGSVVGLSKCLVEQIYRVSMNELRYKYVKGLMNLIANLAGQPRGNFDLTRNLLHALCLCSKYRNDEVTNSLFHETYRFKHDLRQLLNKTELDQQSKNRIHELLQHISYCSGLYKGRSDQTPLQSPSFFNSPSFPYPPSTLAPQHFLTQPQRRQVPRTSFLSPNAPSIMRGGNIYANPQPLTTPTSFTLTPPSHDSSMPSSADSKVCSRRNEDLKSSGYSETSMNSNEHLQRGHRFNMANGEYAEPKKQAFIRNLHPAGLALHNQQWASPTNSSTVSSMYENHDVIVKGSSENYSEPSHPHYSPEENMFNQDANYYQNEDAGQEGAGEFCHLEPEFGHYGSEESLYCNHQSRQQSMTSILTLPFSQSEGISPKSQNLSPINESEVSESDSASHRGVLVDKNGSMNTTPRTTSTAGRKQSNDENSTRAANQYAFELQNLHLNNEDREPFNQTF